MPGEEARVSNVCLCLLTTVAWYVLIFRSLVPLKGCKLRMKIQHSVRTFHWLPVTATLDFDILALSTQVSVVDIC